MAPQAILNILAIDGQAILTLSAAGVATLHHAVTHACIGTLNRGADEVIDHVFLAYSSSSLVVVTTVARTAQVWALPTKHVLRGQFEARQRIFRPVALGDGGFVEFDDQCQVALTKCSRAGQYTVWSLATFLPRFTLPAEEAEDVKLGGGDSVVVACGPYSTAQRTATAAAADSSAWRAILPGSGARCMHLTARSVLDGSVKARATVHLSPARLDLIECMGDAVFVRQQGALLYTMDLQARTMRSVPGTDRIPPSGITLFTRPGWIGMVHYSQMWVFARDGQLLHKLGYSHLPRGVGTAGVLCNVFTDVDAFGALALRSDPAGHVSVTSIQPALGTERVVLSARQLMQDMRTLEAGILTRVTSLYANQWNGTLIMGMHTGEVAVWQIGSKAVPPIGHDPAELARISGLAASPRIDGGYTGQAVWSDASRAGFRAEAKPLAMASVRPAPLSGVHVLAAWDG